MHNETVNYRDGDAQLRGQFYYDATTAGRRPGILVMPPGSGLGEHSKERAQRLAKLGYAALAADPFGGGAVAGNYEEAEKFAALFKDDAARFRQRVRASLDALAARPEVDATRMGAIGFCMGGTFVLELARSGAPVAGVVTFHGLLEAKRPARAGEIKAKILVCNGADDPFVPQSAIDGFTAEMTAAQVDWQIISYAGAKHSFTNPLAGDYGRPGLAYHPHADTHSWTAMTRFFSDLFAG